MFYIDFLLKILISIGTWWSLLIVEYYLQPMRGMFQRYHTASLNLLISCSKAHVELGVGCSVN